MTQRFIKIAEDCGVLEHDRVLFSDNLQIVVAEQANPEKVLEFGQRIVDRCVAQLALIALANDQEVRELMDLAISNIKTYWNPK